MGRIFGKFVGQGFTKEIPSGTVNGTNVAFTLANLPASAGAVLLAQNGLVLDPAEYSITGLNITMTTAPALGQTLIAFYLKQS